MGLHSGPVVIPPAAIRANTNGRAAQVVARTFRDGTYEVAVEIDGQRLVMADTPGAQEGSTVVITIEDSEVLRLSVDEV